MKHQNVPWYSKSSLSQPNQIKLSCPRARVDHLGPKLSLGILLDVLSVVFAWVFAQTCGAYNVRLMYGTEVITLLKRKD